MEDISSEQGRMEADRDDGKNSSRVLNASRRRIYIYKHCRYQNTSQRKPYNILYEKKLS